MSLQQTTITLNDACQLLGSLCHAARRKGTAASLTTQSPEVLAVAQFAQDLPYDSPSWPSLLHLLPAQRIPFLVPFYAAVDNAIATAIARPSMTHLLDTVWANPTRATDRFSTVDKNALLRDIFARMAHDDLIALCMWDRPNMTSFSQMPLLALAQTPLVSEPAILHRILAQVSRVNAPVRVDYIKALASNPSMPQTGHSTIQEYVLGKMLAANEKIPYTEAEYDYTPSYSTPTFSSKDCAALLAQSARASAVTPFIIYRLVDTFLNADSDSDLYWDAREVVDLFRAMNIASTDLLPYFLDNLKLSDTSAFATSLQRDLDIALPLFHSLPALEWQSLATLVLSLVDRNMARKYVPILLKHRSAQDLTAPMIERVLYLLPPSFMSHVAHIVDPTTWNMMLAYYATNPDSRTLSQLMAVLDHVPAHIRLSLVAPSDFLSTAMAASPENVARLIPLLTAPKR